MRVQPFEIAIDDAVLADLRDRLRRTRWPDTVAGSGWDHGTDVDYLRSLAAYWADGFDWRAQARLLDERLPGYVVERRAAGQPRRVHFARLPGRGPAPFPLLLLHGWPGSFAEMYKIAPALADPAARGGDPADAFDVIVPSLPGHGFTDPVLDRPFGADECADLLAELLAEVWGVDRVGVQGGDRGAFVAASLGARHPHLVAGIHLNFPTGIPGTGDEQTGEERAWLAQQSAWMAEEGGYIAIQGTRTQTLGYALND
jgi:microsomal epoxide hydrolase